MRVLLLSLIVLLSFSCSDSNTNTIPPEDCIPVIFDVEKFNDQSKFTVDLVEFSLDVDCLNVKLTVSGCDEIHPIDMVSDGGILKTNPPQIIFDFFDGTPQDCEAIFLLDRTFDLSPIKEVYDGEIIINFRNNDKTLNYPQ